MKNKKAILYIMLLILGAALYIVGIYMNEQMRNGLPLFFMTLGLAIFFNSIERIRKLARGKNPDIRPEMEIEAKDERNQYITTKAKAFAFDVMGYVFSAVFLIYALMKVDFMIFFVLAVSLIGIYITYTIYKNKLTQNT